MATTLTVALLHTLAALPDGSAIVSGRVRGETHAFRFSGDSLARAQATLLARYAETSAWARAHMPEESGPEMVVMAHVRITATMAPTGVWDAVSWSYPTLQGWVHSAPESHATAMAA